MVLEGHIAGMADDELVISRQVGRFDSEPVDTVKVTGGKFFYENPDIVTGSYNFMFTNAQLGFGGILEPVEMTVSGDVKTAERGWLPVEIESKGFEVLSITNDSNHEQWKKAIQGDATPWIHVCDHDGKVAKEYGVTVIPHLFLLSPEGKIEAINIRGEALTRKLEAIYQNKF